MNAVVHLRKSFHEDFISLLENSLTNSRRIDLMDDAVFSTVFQIAVMFATQVNIARAINYSHSSVGRFCNGSPLPEKEGTRRAIVSDLVRYMRNLSI